MRILLVFLTILPTIFINHMIPPMGIINEKTANVVAETTTEFTILLNGKPQKLTIAYNRESRLPLFQLYFPESTNKLTEVVLQEKLEFFSLLYQEYTDDNRNWFSDELKFIGYQIVCWEILYDTIFHVEIAQETLTLMADNADFNLLQLVSELKNKLLQNTTAENLITYSISLDGASLTYDEVTHKRRYGPFQILADGLETYRPFLEYQTARDDLQIIKGNEAGKTISLNTDYYVTTDNFDDSLIELELFTRKYEYEITFLDSEIIQAQINNCDTPLATISYQNIIFFGEMILQVLTTEKIPLENFAINLKRNEEVIISGVSNQAGVVEFSEILAGIYQIEVNTADTMYKPFNLVTEISLLPDKENSLPIMMERIWGTVNLIMETDFDSSSQFELYRVVDEEYQHETTITGIDITEKIISIPQLDSGKYLLKHTNNNLFDNVISEFAITPNTYNIDIAVTKDKMEILAETGRKEVFSPFIGWLIIIFSIFLIKQRTVIFFEK